MHRYRLEDPDLLRRLMRRTGSGAPMSVRDLAAAIDGHRSKSTIGNLVSGMEAYCTPELAHRVAEAIGVNVLILFVPEVSKRLDESGQDAA